MEKLSLVISETELSGEGSGLSALLANFKTFTLEKVFYSLLLLLLCLIVIRILTRIVGLYIITVLIVADTLGIPMTSLLALFSVLGLAVSLAVQDILSNVAGGLVILFSKPFQIGDYIETDQCAGTVVSIDLIHTKLDTFNGQRVMMPNSALSGSKITNFTQLGTRRIDHAITASYDDAIPAVRSACLLAVERTEHVRSDPAPAVVVTAYGESAIEYHVRCWSDVVTMTYNHLNVHIVENLTEAKTR